MPTKKRTPQPKFQRAIPDHFKGYWRIISTEGWDRDALDMIVPAHFMFKTGGGTYFKMIVVEGELDCRFYKQRVEFSWRGDDDGHPVGGRGKGEIGDDGKMRGRLFFHRGDDSAFVAERQ